MTGEMIGGITRALLSAAGGYFIAKGTIDASTWATVSGAAATLAVAAWSIFNKVKK